MIYNLGGKSLRDRNLTKNYLRKRAILASGLRTIFLSEKLDGLFDKLKLLRAGNNSNIFKGEIVAIIDKLLEYKGITPTQHKKKFFKFILI